MSRWPVVAAPISRGLLVSSLMVSPVALLVWAALLLASCGPTSAYVVPQSCAWYRSACSACLSSLPRTRETAGAKGRDECPPCGREDEACREPPSGLHRWPDKTTDDAPETGPADTTPSDDASTPSE